MMGWLFYFVVIPLVSFSLSHYLLCKHRCCICHCSSSSSLTLRWKWCRAEGPLWGGGWTYLWCHSQAHEGVRALSTAPALLCLACSALLALAWPLRMFQLQLHPLRQEHFGDWSPWPHSSWLERLERASELALGSCQGLRQLPTQKEI